MKLVGLMILEDFCQIHPDCRSSIKAWVNEIKEAKWKNPAEMKSRYRNASIVKDNQVIFNIRGNNYRLHTKINYKNQTVLVKNIGTHSEYDNWKF